ncbi:MAG: CHASE domain-containing protein [Thermoanaerobaculia bacterium]|nr:CHASE domain-containing protein [Thermoanaerobaculia bacterium]
MRTRIVVGLERLETLLRGGAAFFDASERTTREEWHAYVSGLRMGTRYPGVQGLGFVRAFPCRERESLVEQVRAEGLPDFRLWPEPPPDREACSAVVWIKPCEGRNLRALGYDGLSEQVRRAALERARDEDDTALSAPLVLIQESGADVQPGALISVPVYRGGRPGPGVEERRARLLGWVYAVVRLDDVMHGILGPWHEVEGRRLRLRVWDGALPGGGPLLWDGSEDPAPSATPVAAVTLPVHFGGRDWTLGFDPAPGSGRSLFARAWLVATAGTAVSLLLVALLGSLRRLRLLNEELEERVADRTRDLDATNAELQAFAYTVAHDLKAPLRAVSGFTALVLEGKEAHLDAESRRLLGRVLDAAHRGGLLIEGLLRHAALARATLARRRVDVEAVARGVASDLGARAPERGVEWKVESGLAAEADESLLREALERLLENALKFTAGRDLARIEVGAERIGSETVFFVRDDGAGFDPAHAHRLFQPFQRAHAPDEFPGLGIGLALAARIIGRHGGWIRIDSSPGRGTTVRFTLAPGRSS